MTISGCDTVVCIVQYCFCEQGTIAPQFWFSVRGRVLAILLGDRVDDNLFSTHGIHVGLSLRGQLSGLAQLLLPIRLHSVTLL